ncbi:hypothetical protein LguiA_002205 [Lonicera macranthoides]
MNGRIMEEDEGWSKFGEENEVEVGDFLVFRHEGDLVFEVLLFDPSALLKPILFLSPPNPRLHFDTSSSQEVYIGLNKIPKKHEECNFGIEDRVTTKCSRNTTKTTTTHHDDDGERHGHPYFSSTLTASNIKGYGLYIPMEFARLNGLIGRNCEMIMKDEQGRTWPLRLKHSGNHVCITRRFHHFLTANGLKEGDSFVVHLLQNGNKPLMNFRSIDQSKIGKVEGKELLQEGFEENVINPLYFVFTE